MVYSTPEQLSFHPIAGHTVRADFEGGPCPRTLVSSYSVASIARLAHRRLAAAIHDTRHPSYIDHPLRDLLAQRIYQIASGHADGNDANSLRRDPLFKLGLSVLWLPSRTRRVRQPSRGEHRGS